MAPDDELLKKARQAQSQLAEAERQVLLSDCPTWYVISEAYEPILKAKYPKEC